MNHVLDLLAHSEWADAEFFGQWALSPARDHEELRHRVAHVRGVRRGFVSLLAGGGPVYPPPGPPPGFDALKAESADTHAKLRAFAAGLTAEAAAFPVAIPWFQNPPCELTTAEALLQVVLHTQHHRGQLMTRLKDLGGTPDDVDYVIWIWRGRPAAGW